MIHDNEDFYRFMFWHCGDSKKTVYYALQIWAMYHRDDEEEIKTFNDANNIKENITDNLPI